MLKVLTVVSGVFPVCLVNIGDVGEVSDNSG